MFSNSRSTWKVQKTIVGGSFKYDVHTFIYENQNNVDEMCTFYESKFGHERVSMFDMMTYVPICICNDTSLNLRQYNHAIPVYYISFLFSYRSPWCKKYVGNIIMSIFNLIGWSTYAGPRNRRSIFITIKTRVNKFQLKTRKRGDVDYCFYFWKLRICLLNSGYSCIYA